MIINIRYKNADGRGPLRSEGLGQISQITPLWAAVSVGTHLNIYYIHNSFLVRLPTAGGTGYSRRPHSPFIVFVCYFHGNQISCN
jgi:hypothetical protein